MRNFGKYFDCPCCTKALIRLHPITEGEYDFWCDECDIDIKIVVNDEVEGEYND